MAGGVPAALLFQGVVSLAILWMVLYRLQGSIVYTTTLWAALHVVGIVLFASFPASAWVSRVLVLCGPVVSTPWPGSALPPDQESCLEGAM